MCIKLIHSETSRTHIEQGHKLCHGATAISVSINTNTSFSNHTCEISLFNSQHTQSRNMRNLLVENDHNYPTRDGKSDTSQE